MTVTLERLEQALRTGAPRALPAPEIRQALRRGSGLSTQALADLLGCSRQSVSAWERGTRTPRGQWLLTYLDALDALRRAC